MRRVLSLAGTGLDAVAVVFKAAIALLLLVMLTINIINIISRSLLNDAYDWVFHWTMLMFIWMICLGVYVYMRENRDVVVDLIAARMPMPIRRALAIFADMTGLLFMYMVLSPALELTAMQTGHMETIALPIYVSSLPLFTSAMFLVMHFSLHALNVLTGEIIPYPRTTPRDLLEAGQSQ
ncbi:TRAP transporter small permease [Roseibium algae]|uniref:TRAP transporter small permease protein n=1 Tax=Roseibium algae TaxID=3123038 RepID=A0ABU8TMG0_9HYPH